VGSSRRGLRRAGGEFTAGTAAGSRLAGGRGREAGAVYNALLIVSRDNGMFIISISGIVIL
jgi:ABC-type xylose transport system permease subunit